MIISFIKNVIKKTAPVSVLKAMQTRLLNKQRDKFRQGNLILLYHVDDILTKAGIPYWLNYGTLLGAYRDNDFIPHDYDLDIGLMMQYHQHVKSLLLSNGFIQVFEAHMGCSWDNPEIVEYRFKYSDVCIDFNFYIKQDNKVTTYDFVPIKDINYTPNPNKRLPILVEGVTSPLMGLTTISFKDRLFSVPANTEEYIVANYGPSWRTPVKDWDYHDYAENIKVYKPGEVYGEIIIFS